MRTRHLSLEGLFHLHWSLIHAATDRPNLHTVHCSRAKYRELPSLFRELVDNLLDPVELNSKSHLYDQEAKNLSLTDFIRENSKFRLHPLVFMINDSL